MEQMKDFVMWFLTQLPSFLLTEPISYFVGFFFLFFTFSIIRRIMSVGNTYL